MVLVVEVIALSPWTDPVAGRPPRQVDPVALAEVDRYGVNTFLHKEVDRWKKEQTLDMAHQLKPALDLIGHVSPILDSPKAAPASDSSPAGTLDTAKIAAIVGHAGEQTGPVYKITVGRDDLTAKEMGATINARMGLNTWAAFYGSDERAVVAGDIAMLEGEVTPVLKALRSNNLEVVGPMIDQADFDFTSIIRINGARRV